MPRMPGGIRERGNPMILPAIGPSLEEWYGVEGLAELERQWKARMKKNIRLIGHTVILAKGLLDKEILIGFEETSLDGGIFLVFNRYRYQQLREKLNKGFPSFTNKHFPSIEELEEWTKEGTTT